MEINGVVIDNGRICVKKACGFADEPRNSLKASVRLKAIQIGKRTVAYAYGLENERFISMPKPPPNSALVRVDEPVWWQFCGEGYLITRGIVWCNDGINEVKRPDYAVERYKKGWLIYAPKLHVFMRNYNIFGVFYFENGKTLKLSRPLEEEKLSFDNGLIANYGVGKIKELDDFLVQEYKNTRIVVPKNYVDMAKIEYGGRTFFVPLAYLAEVPGVVL